MTSQGEISRALEDAIKAVVANRQGSGSPGRVLQTSKKYERLSGLSHRQAINTIYQEAERRLEK